MTTEMNNSARPNDDDPWEDLAEQLFGVEVGKEHRSDESYEPSPEAPPPEPPAAEFSPVVPAAQPFFVPGEPHIAAAESVVEEEAEDSADDWSGPEEAEPDELAPESEPPVSAEERKPPTGDDTFWDALADWNWDESSSSRHAGGRPSSGEGRRPDRPQRGGGGGGRGGRRDEPRGGRREESRGRSGPGPDRPARSESSAPPSRSTAPPARPERRQPEPIEDAFGAGLLGDEPQTERSTRPVSETPGEFDFRESTPAQEEAVEHTAVPAPVERAAGRERPETTKEETEEDADGKRRRRRRRRGRPQERSAPSSEARPVSAQPVADSVADADEEDEVAEVLFESSLEVNETGTVETEAVYRESGAGLEAGAEEEKGADEAPGRSSRRRRGRRRRRGEPAEQPSPQAAGEQAEGEEILEELEEPASAPGFVETAAEDVDEEEADDESVDHADDESVDHIANYANVPTWEEAISYLLRPNTVQVEPGSPPSGSKRGGPPGEPGKTTTRHYGRRRS